MRISHVARLGALLLTGLTLGSCGSDGGDPNPTPPPVLTASDAALPGGTVGTAYLAGLSASIDGHDVAATWTLTAGAPPAGVSLQNATMTGVPTTAGSYTFTLRADAQGASDTQAYTVVIAASPTPGSTLTITAPVSNQALPAATVGTAYSFMFTATGGHNSYRWSITQGTLPAGLTLDPLTGRLSGMPTAAGSVNPLVVRVTDYSLEDGNTTADVITRLTVSGGSSGTVQANVPTPLPDAVIGQAYLVVLQASGGTAPYTWAVQSGALPDGLFLGADGRITGTVVGTRASAPLTIRVTDATNTSGTATTQIGAFPLLRMAYSGDFPYIANAHLNGPFEGFTFRVEGGTGLNIFRLVEGTLPNGIVLNATTGTLEGTPTAVSPTADYTARVSSGTQTVDARFSFTVDNWTQLIIQLAGTADGLVGTGPDNLSLSPICERVNGVIFPAPRCASAGPPGGEIRLFANPRGSIVNGLIPGFAGWQGCPATTPSADPRWCIYADNGSRTITATFDRVIGTIRINNTTLGGNGAGRIDGISHPELSCLITNGVAQPAPGKSCHALVRSPGNITIQAVPAPGSQFVSWAGDGYCAPDPRSPVCVIPATNAYTPYMGGWDISATFIPE